MAGINACIYLLSTVPTCVSMKGIAYRLAERFVQVVSRGSLGSTCNFNVRWIDSKHNQLVTGGSAHSRLLDGCCVDVDWMVDVH